MERIEFAKAKGIGELFFFFTNMNTCHDCKKFDAANVTGGVEFFPRLPLNPVPFMTAENLEVYIENCRVKGEFTVLIKNKEGLSDRFNPAFNSIRFLVDDRVSGDDAFGFIDFTGVDLVDLSPPIKREGYDLSFKVRFVMSGFIYNNRIVVFTDEMANWFKSYGLELKNYK